MLSVNEHKRNATTTLFSRVQKTSTMQAEILMGNELLLV